MSEMSQIIQLLNNMSESVNAKLNTIELRLDRLEKVDSIEHRVAVNQIDLCDIKEILQKLEEQPVEKFSDLIEASLQTINSSYQRNFELITKRLDSQLYKIARAEEEIIALKDITLDKEEAR